MFGFAWSVLIGISLGFGFGVGCALAVMYGLFLGGYRTAIRESAADPQPERYLRQSAKVASQVPGSGGRFSS